RIAHAVALPTNVLDRRRARDLQATCQRARRPHVPARIAAREQRNAMIHAGARFCPHRLDHRARRRGALWHHPGTVPALFPDAPNQPTLDDARRVLRDVFGYDAFRGRQEQAIGAALDGRDVLVLMPTGGGKSLRYQITALLRTGVGVVVSPLIALMEDQVRALRELGIRAAFLNSTLGRREQQDVIDDVRSGSLELLYVAPERLLQPQTLEL